MSGSRVQHLQRRLGIFYLRVRVPDDIRSLVGLTEVRRSLHTYKPSRARTLCAVYATLSARQIHFVETIVDYLTSSGQMAPAALYEPPFTDSAPNGISDMFDGTAVARIVDVVESFQPRLAVAV